MRQMKDVTVTFTGPDKKVHTGTFKVLPDYLAIGSNDDFIRVPMSPLTAQVIANNTGTILPTRKIVNDVYQNADKKLPFHPMDPNKQMESSDYYQRHNQFVEDKRIKVGAQNGQLIAGHKKDVVLTNLLDTDPGKVAIFGWFDNNGKRIQPLSTIHGNTYADYSHGIRLVQGKMTVDGVERDVADVLHDKNLAGLISDEPGGIIKSTKYKL
jgi:hypothetical protein